MEGVAGSSPVESTITENTGNQCKFPDEVRQWQPPRFSINDLKGRIIMLHERRLMWSNKIARVAALPRQFILNELFRISGSSYLL